MIRKLQIKLIIASMFSLLLVLSVILCTVGILNYNNILSDADRILSVLAESNGSFPEADRSEKGFRKKDQRFAAEMQYENRFFSVTYTGQANEPSVDSGKIAVVDAQTAIAYAQSVMDSGRTKGSIDSYRYIVYTSGADTRIIFLDCEHELRFFRRFLFTGIGVSALGLLAVLLLVVFFSGKIVKPFSLNYEKQKQFITDGGHELKTPLTIIDADAEVLKMDIGENEWLKDIQSQTKRLAQLTNNLIQLARMDETPETEKIEFPLSDLVEETVEAFQGVARTHDKILTSHIQPMVSMYGNQNSIRQLVTILLDNAIKYSDENGKIDVTLDKQKKYIRLVVFNTAQSVPKESLTRLFDRFYRADPSRNSSTGGYGLGLSIASAIVAAHKGKIIASTRDEKSLSLEVTFPL